MGCCNSKDQRWAFQGPSDLLLPLRESFAVKNPELYVVILRLHQLKRIGVGQRLGTTTDPYCEFALTPAAYAIGEQRQRSSIKTNTLNPKWFPAERFQFKVAGLKSHKIILNVMHFLPVLKPLSIGDAVIHLKDFEVGGTYKRKEYKLIRQEDGSVEGSAIISIQVQTAEQASNLQEHYIYEFQRWKGEWGSIDCFIITDPGRWSTMDGKIFKNDIDDIAPPIPNGWTVLREWMTGTTDHDPEGWEYSTDMRSNYWHPTQDGSIYFVRRRVWSRKVANLKADFKDDNSLGNPV